VIVDEACQSIEISALIPLQFGASKCILVGDPNQLPPTVISQEAQDYLYEQSLFQRIMKGNSDVVQLLTIQYRMHPEICQFPSEFFYASALVNGPRMAELAAAPWHSNTFFRPYQFFDVNQGREQKTHGNSLMNVEEARVCASLIQLLVKEYPRANFAHRIGGIVFRFLPL
jgi:senataxin